MPLLVEAGWGGLVQAPTTITWTDITQHVDVMQGVAINRGASDELSEIQPGTATMRLDNSDGRFTPGNSTSPYYPFVRRNAPIRVAVAVIPERTGAGPTWPFAQLGDDFDDNRVNTTLWPNVYSGSSETGGRARVPLNPGVVAGYQTARAWTLAGSQLTAKLARVPAANGSSSASASMWINSTTSGTRLGFSYSPVTGLLRCMSETAFFDGASTSLTYSAIDHAWLRVRESGGTLYWETSGDGFGWTVRRTLATPAWVGAEIQLLDFSATRTGGTTDYVEWDLVGAHIRPRFWGMVNDWPVHWEGLHSTVTVSATDLFKRLNRLPLLKSCLTEETLVDGPLAYYPLTEPADSLSAGDLSGTTAGVLAITQVGSGGTLEFGSAPGPAATSETSAQLTPVSTSVGKYLSANLGPDYEAQSTSQWNAMEAWFSTSTTGRVIFAVASEDQSFRLVFALSADGSLQIEYGDDVSTHIPVTTGNLADGVLHHIVYDEVAAQVYVDGVTKVVGSVLPPMYDGRVLTVGGFKNARLWNGTIGHVALHTTPSTPLGTTLAEHYTAGTTAFNGETADSRIERLARYAGLSSVTVWGSTHDAVAGQGPAGTGALARMREVETTEAARLFAERDWYGLAYQSRDLRYNPDPLSEVFTIDYADLDTNEVEVADDDQKLVNIVDASRPGGATQRVTASESVLAFGAYEESLDLLKTSDNSVLDAAHWLVSRYADPQPELREVPVEAYSMATYLDILDAEISSYFSVTGLPAQAPASTLRVTVEGYSETIGDRYHRIQFRTSRSATDSVWVLDDSVYSVLDSTTRLAY
ncbi:LamG-like jellyroll fold domain-containing protein [Streptomyces sp. NPDC002994]|uniref:LamG-like jellyroll fold domain-containing protein n=1 Tax=Streptomyces sp. NPDC002994 TaxID=3154441 RepID=UPI0033AB8BC5